MLAEIKAGNVSSVICKDLSRIDRDYLNVGFYAEVLFRELRKRLPEAIERIEHRIAEMKADVTLRDANTLKFEDKEEKFQPMTINSQTFAEREEAWQELIAM